MLVKGETRTAVRANHALIAPDSHVTAALPGWKDTDGIILISPEMGARFQQLLISTTARSRLREIGSHVQRFFYVQQGTLLIKIGKAKERAVPAGRFVWLPPALEYVVRSKGKATFLLFEKEYEHHDNVDVPGPIFGDPKKVKGEPFLGDPDARLQTLLPTDPGFDMAINIFTYQPGARLPFVEVHIMEHGLTMIAGEGVYRLDDQWYPVTEGDSIWMAPYCPQWFVAMGKKPAAYIYYKDMNRDSLRGGML